MFFKIFKILQLSYKHKKKYFLKKLTINEWKLIQILIQYNIVKYVIYNRTKSIIFLKYYNTVNFVKLKNLYKPSNIRTIKKNN